MKPPTPIQLVVQLKHLTKALEDHGQAAVQLAPILAARGWPNATIGTGSPGNPELTSVEAAADDPGRWTDIDHQLERFLVTTYALALAGQRLLTTITAHAAPDDEHQGRSTGQAGTGRCLACERWVSGTEHDRLRAGWCSTCLTAWYRDGRPDRAAFMRTRPKHDDPQQNAG